MKSTARQWDDNFPVDVRNAHRFSDTFTGTYGTLSTITFEKECSDIYLHYFVMTFLEIYFHLFVCLLEVKL